MTDAKPTMLGRFRSRNAAILIVGLLLLLIGFAAKETILAIDTRRTAPDVDVYLVPNAKASLNETEIEAIDNFLVDSSEPLDSAALESMCPEESRMNPPVASRDGTPVLTKDVVVLAVSDAGEVCLIEDIPKTFSGVKMNADEVAESYHPSGPGTEDRYAGHRIELSEVKSQQEYLQDFVSVAVIPFAGVLIGIGLKGMTGE